MKRADIEFVLGRIGATEFKVSGEWIMTNCPLAPWTHEKGTDLRPSFGIREGVGISGVHCFSCGYKGGVMGLVREYARYAFPLKMITEEQIQELVDFIIVAEDEKFAGSVVQEEESIAVPAELEKYLNTYHPYFAERGIDEVTAEMWGLGYVEKFFDLETVTTLTKRVLFPLYEKEDGGAVLRGVIGRAIEDEDVAKYKNSPPKFRKADYLYGEWLKPKEATRIIVVEGPIDVIRVNMEIVDNYGLLGSEYWAVGLMGAHPSSKQLVRLLDMAEEVIVMTDNDAAGKVGKKKLVEGLGNRLIVSTVVWEEGETDPGALEGNLVEKIVGRRYILEEELSKRMFL